VLVEIKGIKSTKEKIRGKGKREKDKGEIKRKTNMDDSYRPYLMYKGIGMRQVLKPITYRIIAYRQSLKLLPEGIVLLVVLCFFGRLRIVFDEPGEVLGVVDFVVEHLFTAGSIMYQLVSFLCYTEAAFIKKDTS
jgi:hypothetical protein